MPSGSGKNYKGPQNDKQSNKAEEELLEQRKRMVSTLWETLEDSEAELLRCAKLSYMVGKSIRKATVLANL